MTFQAPITIKTALDRMHRHDYVLPAIQREFVWDQDRISRLFDSLMRGYPIGSFLFWKIEPKQAADYTYYDFIRDFHRRDRTHCERLHIGTDRQVTAILDGQQRFTSLNIGLAGSFAEKLPRLWWNNPYAYPKSHLYLDLEHEPSVDEDLEHRFALLTDASDIRFRVQNFHRTNMERLEADWPKIAQALMTAAQLLARFGFSARTLPSNSILIPLADWLHRNGHDHRFVTGVAHRDERERIRSWVLRSQLKAGVFGSGLDTLLARLRRGIRDNPGPAFPVEALEKEMAALGKSPTFDVEELEDLVELPFGNRRVFVLLALLYPGIDVNGDYHVDHVYPRAVFTKKNLRDAGLGNDEVEDYRTKVNLLPNLQLLEGSENQSKQAVLPHTWVAEAITDAQHRQEYLDRHDLHDLGTSLTDFGAFYDARRSRLMARLKDLLRRPTHG